MIQQVFGFLFVLAFVLPVVAVIIGTLSLAVPVRPHGAGHPVSAPVHT